MLFLCQNARWIMVLFCFVGSRVKRFCANDQFRVVCGSYFRGNLNLCLN